VAERGGFKGYFMSDDTLTKAHSGYDYVQRGQITYAADMKINKSKMFDIAADPFSIGSRRCACW
jgi:hypothetical protein